MADNIETIGSDVSRDRANMQIWESANDGDHSAATGDSTRQIGECYDDSAFSESLTIDGSTTDSDYYMWIRAASGEEFDHTTGTGVRNSFAHLGILGKDDYTRIGGSEGASSGGIGITLTTESGDSYGVRMRLCDACRISQITCYSFEATEVVRALSEDGTCTNNTYWNCLAYDLYSSDDSGTYDCYGMSLSNDATAYNCTMHDITSNGGDDCFGFFNAACYNCYGGGVSGGTDVNLVYNASCTGDYNAADDTSSSIFTYNLQSKAAADQFENVSDPGRDYHLKSGADLIDAGNDTYGNEFDLDGSVSGARDDMGADEYEAAVSGKPWYVYAQQ